MADDKLNLALQEIDRAHAEDPTKTSNGEAYELHYANRMTHYLQQHTPDASPLLQLAVRAQHFRRWEVPRDTYPKTKVGYFSWRTYQKKKAGEQVKTILMDCGYSEQDAGRVASLIGKEDLKKGEGNGDAEVQVLEDCACLVFLDDQFDSYEAKWADEHGSQEEADDKMISILRKTWAKMGQRGRDLALEMHMSPKQQELVGKALAGA